MSKRFGLLAIVAACGGETEMFPPPGGGGGGGGADGGQTVDARLADARTADASVALIDANLFMGRVCLVTDPRKLDVCANTGAGGLTVRLGSATTTTADDGTFSIEGQSGGNLVWRITGSNIVSAYEVLRDYQIPAITRATFQQMMTQSGVMFVPGEGSMIIQVSRNGAGLAGATATIDPGNQSFYSPRYDAATATAWEQDATDANGAIWIPGLDVGSATVTVHSGGEMVGAGGPVFDDGITFTNVIYP